MILRPKGSVLGLFYFVINSVSELRTIHAILLIMKSRIIILFGVFSLLVTIIIYVLFFYDVTISDRTSDWGAFGSYIGIGISVLSETLFYITYNEQRHSNEIERFELHLKTMLGTFSELI